MEKDKTGAGGTDREMHGEMSMEKQREEQKHRKGAEDRRETDTKKKIEKRGRSDPPTPNIHKQNNSNND